MYNNLAYAPFRSNSFRALIVFAALFVLCEKTSAQASASKYLSPVCRATVAAIMGRDISIVKLNRIESDVAYVQYTRPSDGIIWKNRCRIQSNKVVWGTVDAFGPGTGFGRWRDDPADEIITYSIDGKKVTIIQTFSDGSQSTKNFLVEP